MNGRLFHGMGAVVGLRLKKSDEKVKLFNQNEY